MRIGIRVKLLIFAALVWAVIFGIYSVYIYNERIAQTQRMAHMTASYLTRELAAGRQYYTSTVVKKALDSGLSVSSSYLDEERSIPLHLTFLKEASQGLGSEGFFHMELVSLRPVNPANLPKDDFQREALGRFDKGASAEFYRFEDYKGKRSIRYMLPDVATSQTCVDCHNNHAASPKKDYRIGDVTGGLEVIIPIENELAAAMNDIWRSIGFGFVVVLAMGLVGLAFIRKVVTSPILSLVETTRHLASGDLTGKAEVDSNDEIGDLGVQMNEVVRNLHRMIEDMRRTSDEATGISKRVAEMSSSVLEGSNAQGAALDSIGANMGGINASISGIANYTEVLAKSLEKGSISVLELGASINEVVDSMEALSMSVDETSSSTRDMSFSIKDVSESIESLSSAVTQVSSSITHISASIREVEANAAEASMFAEEVIKDAKAGMETVESTIDGILKAKEITRESTHVINSLSERIKEIGKILDVIQEVAEETNLLALNAAIIAAQTGDHGKSFSVVANEIKDLAERASTSAKEVSEIIHAVEIESDRAVKSMERGYLSVEEGVRLSMKAGEGLEKILGSAQRSTTSVRQIAAASELQARESRMVAETTEKLAEMTRRIVNATHEHARGSELINKATERMSDITYRVKATTKSQAESTRQITSTIGDVNRMVTYINDVIKEQSRNTTKVIEALDAVRKVSFENIERAVAADRAVEELARLDREMTERVKRFKLK
ncbi:MAG: methyl-accepting chemotaxis protein [Thermodesulfobacteriota bacterium]|nr:MAG: methyl-accepting chemotaxis protein [Thermodesulfobacteriota bacterium]